MNSSLCIVEERELGSGGMATDVVNFKGRSMAELKKEFAKSMEVYFDFCRERGEEPEQPFSGKFILRVDPAVHRAITRAADREGTKRAALSATHMWR